MAQQNSARIRQKKRQQLILALIVLLVLGGGAYAMLGMQKKPAPVQAQRPAGYIAIPKVTRDIPIGGRISGNLIRTSFVPPERVPTDALIAPDQYIGRYVRRSIPAGDYIRESDVATSGAPGTYSGIAKPGYRVVVLSAALFPGSIFSIRVGDKIDLLSISQPGPGGALGGGNLPALGPASVAGTQPGATAERRRRAQAPNTANRGILNATSATLVAEGAEVMTVPVPNGRRGRNANTSLDTEFIVLQMTPQDAHVTTLAAASGAYMRYVFRPFNDEVRLTESKPLDTTTRMPRAKPDPNTITMIYGTDAQQQSSFMHTDRYPQ
ncbi:SAF domain-containing protein [Methylobacillus flagellatus]|uniref:SAF domain-containing protein n=1 Tax=Methylobacillus flagellatus TaxID=405 RepID=UPI0010F5248B|nr:SAF domain-containing protein [Methylobacillus flagellatus]